MTESLHSWGWYYNKRNRIVINRDGVDVMEVTRVSAPGRSKSMSRHENKESAARTLHCVRQLVKSGNARAAPKGLTLDNVQLFMLSFCMCFLGASTYAVLCA